MSSKKHKGRGPQAMTANDLREGMNLWMTPDYAWSADFTQALLSEDAEVIAHMQERAERDENSNLVVGAYFIDVDPETGLPARYRERFRVSGPTNDLGAELKQKELKKKDRS